MTPSFPKIGVSGHAGAIHIGLGRFVDFFVLICAALLGLTVGSLPAANATSQVAVHAYDPCAAKPVDATDVKDVAGFGVTGNLPDAFAKALTLACGSADTLTAMLALDVASRLAPATLGGLATASVGASLTTSLGLGNDSLNPAGAMTEKASVRPKGCFVAGTPVLMADGTQKPIEDVQPGDTVAAFNTDTGQIEPGLVTQTFIKHDIPTRVLTLEDGSSLATTDEHPFWVEHQGFTPAHALQPGQQLHQPNNQPATLKTNQPTGHTTTVYNLEIAHHHTYHVKTTTTWLTVHNTCEPGDSGIRTAPAREFTRSETLSGKSSTKRVRQIEDSMRSDGWDGPPISVVELQGQKIVVDGHHRLAAARRAGIDVQYRVLAPSSVIPKTYRSVDELLKSTYSVGMDRLR